MPNEYDLSVFINCPFDEGYDSLFDAILFSVYRCGFKPRCALEIEASGSVRIDKIIKIIKECRVGIHDISRTELDTANNLPRFNMPLELGIFLGAQKFGATKQKNKISIILDVEKFRFQKYISDLGSQDIKSHNNSPDQIIKSIRKFLHTSKINSEIVGADKITKEYYAYTEAKPEIMKEKHLTINDLTYADKTQLIERWLTLTM